MDARNLRQKLPDNPRLASDFSRDCPSPRPTSQFSRPTESRFAQRKPTPSPLQASETPACNTSGLSQSGPVSPQSPSSLRKTSDACASRSPNLNLAAHSSPPKSPRDRLDELLASEASATQGILGSAGDADITKSVSPAPSKTQTYNQLRNISSPLPQVRPQDTSPPQSPTSSASTSLRGATMRPDARSFPRTSSIDSAISNISSITSHSHKSPQDSFRSNTPDISSLISAAGSAEVVIHHLLKEKQHAAAQNAQLWKLVDKQRTLVLGLNQDLDRALKDKERYRKKLKEHISQAPPASSHHSHRPSQDQGLRNASPASTNTHDELPIQKHETDEQLASEGHSTASSSLNTPSPGKSTNEAPTAPFDAKPAVGSRNPTAHDVMTSSRVGREIPPLQTNNMGASKPNALLETSPENASNVVSPSSFTAKRSNNLRSTGGGPTLAVTESTPTSTEQTQPPFRKLPPAPLDLHKPKLNIPAHTEFGPEDHSDSEYEDKTEADELPTFERGRKKTREEDDKEREVALIKQQIERSQSSKKQRGSKVPSEPALSKTCRSPGSVPKRQAPMPPGIKALSPQLTSGGDSDFLSPPTSLAGVLSPPTKEQRRSSSEGKIMSVPPLSPGLPLSPGRGTDP